MWYNRYMNNNKKYLNKKWLEKEYANRRSVTRIAEKCGVAVTTISRWLAYFEIRKKNTYYVDRNGPKNPYWKGGKYKDRLNGYISVYNPSHPFANKKGYVREHRLVMEKILGRYLRKNEIVHHRNKKKDDNQIENLEIILLGEVNGGDIRCPHCSKIFKLS